MARTPYTKVGKMQDVPTLTVDPVFEPPLSNGGQPMDTTSRRNNILLAVALLVPVFFETLDYTGEGLASSSWIMLLSPLTVVATAQVHIASTFNALNLQSYIGTAYLLTSTVFLPLFASVADIWGRHFTLQISLFLFLVGSALSTAAQNMPMMLVGRGVAGVGSAGLQSAVRIILADSRSLQNNGWQQAMLFYLYTIGYCAGPVIGGALVNISFRWIFAINLPFCALGMVLAFFILRKRTKGAQGPRTLPAYAGEKETFLDKFVRVDWVGAFFFTAGGILLLLALNWGPMYGWKAVRVIVCLVLGVVLYAAFVGVEIFLERRADISSAAANRLLATEPMLPLGIFHSYDVCAAEAAAFVSGMIIVVMFYFVSIFFTMVTGLSSTNAGLQLIYFAPGMGAGSMVQIYMMKWFKQPKYPIVVGSIIMTIGIGLISMGMQQNNKSMVDGFIVLAGMGVGLSIGAIVMHNRLSQPEDRVAIVAAVGLFFRALGGTVGLAQCGAVLNSKVKSYTATLVASGTLSPADASALSTALADGLTSLSSISGLPQNVQGLIRDAFRDGSRWAFLSLVPWAALASVAVLFLSRIDEDVMARAEAVQSGHAKQPSASTIPLQLARPDEEEPGYAGGSVY